MVAYSFKPQFRAPIVAGTKRQTIRADRKRHARPGEDIQLYTGMRTMFCRAVGIATCLRADRVALDFDREIVRIDCANGGITTIYRPGLDEFAVSDGFERGWPQMREFWRDSHSDANAFDGVLIRWVDFRPAAGGE